MFLKTLIKKTSNLIYKILFFHTLIKSSYKNIKIKGNNLMIIVIAFNNKEILETQEKYLQENLKEKYDYIVADNSTKINVSEKIKLFCKEKNISYIKIPSNPLNGVRASGSHGIALNWCMKNIIRKYKPKYFGFLDHDIFPLKEVCVTDKLKSGFSGITRTRGDKYFYLWPGFCFFDFEKVKNFKFNFFPHHSGRNGLTFLDTGGSNYYSIYKKTSRKEIQESSSKLINLNTGKEFIKGENSSQTFEIIDSTWLHLRQIAWREESFNKMNKKDDFINSARKFLD